MRTDYTDYLNLKPAVYPIFPHEDAKHLLSSVGPHKDWRERTQVQAKMRFTFCLNTSLFLF